MPEGAVLGRPPVVDQAPPIDKRPQNPVAGGNEPSNPLQQIEDVAKNAWDSTEGNVPQTAVHDEAEGVVRDAFAKPAESDLASPQSPESFVVSQPVPAEVGVPSTVGIEGPAQQQKKKVPFGKLGAAVGIAAATMFGGNGAPINGDMQVQQPRPAPIVETVGIPTPPTNITKIEQVAPENSLKDVAPVPVDESLACPATKEYVVKPGGSLSRGLIEVNGLGRYLNADGTFDENKIYKDLLCTIYLPENMDQLAKSDPVLHAAVKSLQDNVAITGSVTADMLRDVVIKVNEPRRYTRPDGTPSNPQLGLTFAKDATHPTPDSWTLPDFTSKQQPTMPSVKAP